MAARPRLKPPRSSCAGGAARCRWGPASDAGVVLEGLDAEALVAALESPRPAARGAGRAAGSLRGGCRTAGPAARTASCSTLPTPRLRAPAGLRAPSPDDALAAAHRVPHDRGTRCSVPAPATLFVAARASFRRPWPRSCAHAGSGGWTPARWPPTWTSGRGTTAGRPGARARRPGRSRALAAEAARRGGRGRTRLPVVLHGPERPLGPLVVPGRGPCLRCLDLPAATATRRGRRCWGSWRRPGPLRPHPRHPRDDADRAGDGALRHGRAHRAGRPARAARGVAGGLACRGRGWRNGTGRRIRCVAAPADRTTMTR